MLGNTHSLGLDQCAELIKAIGSEVTVLLRGDMGNGKTSVAKTLHEELPEHVLCMLDCSSLDLGDLAIPNLSQAETEKYVSFAVNEALGLHLGKPVIVCLDEFGKANPAVKTALCRFMLERQFGTLTLHPDSIVFATTNKGAEGVGDLLLPHQRNRIAIVDVRKSTAAEWVTWGINNGIDHSLLGWVKQNPQVLQSFEDVENPDDNIHIFHPKAQRESFVTPRALELASKILHRRALFDGDTLKAALAGVIGAPSAQDFYSFLTLASKLPSLESIKADPNTATLPDTPATKCMTIYRGLAAIERDWVDAWMTYLLRFDPEAQALFVKGALNEKYPKRKMMMHNSKFCDWAVDNGWINAEAVKKGV